MTYDQQLIFKQNSDSGDNDDASIQPLLTEPATPENADRPLQHLRRRTERVRAAVETLLYLADYDRALALRSNAKFALANSGGNYTLPLPKFLAALRTKGVNTETLPATIRAQVRTPLDRAEGRRLAALGK
jgi:hypothetical protein